MNSIRQIQELNKQELNNGVSPEASWHTDYRDTAYIYIGGLPFELSEGDVLTIFSQYGEPAYVKLVRDKETGKSKGFAFLKYEDQRSTDLAVDNLGGTTIMGRMLKVDHTRYKRKDDEDGEESATLAGTNSKENGHGDLQAAIDKPLLEEELELAALIRDHDDDDPMKPFLIAEKKEEISTALASFKGTKSPGKDRNKRRHRQSHESMGKASRGEDRERSHRQRNREDEMGSHRISRDRSDERYSDNATARSRHRDSHRRHY